MSSPPEATVADQVEDPLEDPLGAKLTRDHSQRPPTGSADPHAHASGASGLPEQRRHSEEDTSAADTAPTAIPSEQQHHDMTLLTRALDAGCNMLQSMGPIKKIHQHVCAFHMYSHDATRPVRAHHYCAHRSGEMRQCVLYDSDEPGARLIGIEYIISRRLFESLPVEERKYWHSHVYEVKSGMLVAPGVPGVAEDADMRDVINTYGKIWHTWQVDRGDPLPLGPPQLMMAYTADGQLPPDLLAQRDKDEGVRSDQVRHRRRLMSADPPEPPPDADHPWHTGRAWQVVMQQVDFKAPEPGSVPLPGMEAATGAGGEAIDTLRPGGGGASGGVGAGGLGGDVAGK